MTAADANAAPLSDSELADLECWHVLSKSWNTAELRSCCNKCLDPWPCDAAKLLRSHRAQAARLAALTERVEQLRACPLPHFNVYSCACGHIMREMFTPPRAGEPEGAGESG